MVGGKTITEAYVAHIEALRRQWHFLAIEHLARTISATAGGKLIATLREVAATRPAPNYGEW
jgi:hypothetical protein